MRNNANVSIVLITLVLGGLGAATAQAQSGRNVIRPEDNGRALVNPDMGWMFYYYAHADGDLESDRIESKAAQRFPGLSTVYLRVPWRYLEPKEDSYNWSLLNGPAQKWIEQGKRVAIRITAAEPWMKQATPDWVKDAGATGELVTVNNQSIWAPDTTNKVFRRHLEDLLKGTAQRYGENRDVAFIDMGTLGPGGNGAGQAGQTTEQQAVRQHIKLYRNAFPETRLTISDKLARGQKPYENINYAKDQGYTLRMVQPDPRDWSHQSMIEDVADRRPIVLEHGHGQASGAKGQGAEDSGQRLLEAIETYRASYVGVRRPRRFLHRHRATVAKVNRRLGYRLQLRRISLPKSVGLTEKFKVKTTWANAGVVPCYPGGYMSLTLKNDNGGIVAVLTDSKLNMRELKTGPRDDIPVTQHTSEMVASRVANMKLGDHFLPKQKTATYDVYVSVGKLDGTPTIALPLNHGDGHKRYRIGQIKLTK